MWPTLPVLCLLLVLTASHSAMAQGVHNHSPTLPEADTTHPAIKTAAPSPPPTLTSAKTNNETSTSALGYVALVPGVLVHGLGQYAAGNTTTGKRLMYWQAIGLGAMIASGSYIGFSGASRHGTEFAIPVLIGGTGLFLATWIADVTGTISGGSSYSGLALPDVSFALGYSVVKSPRLPQDHFWTVSATFRQERWRFGVDYMQSGNGQSLLGRAPVEYDLLSSDEGERLFVGAGISAYRHGQNTFSMVIPEVTVGARANLDRLGPTLKGSFVTFSWGLAWQLVKYPGVASRDSHRQLVGGFGYGFFLPKSGEIEFYYQHRRDNFVGGISPSRGQGSGFLGYAGARLRQPITSSLAINANAQFGAAYVGTIALEWSKR